MIDSDNFVYKPYRTHAIFTPMVVVMGLLSFMASGMVLSGGNVSIFLIYISVGVLCVVLAKHLYDSTKIVIIFEADGLVIINDGCSKYCHILWQELSFGYYTRNYKGHSYLVLSPETLCKKRLRQLVNRGANLSRVCVETVVVIHIDGLQDTSQIKATVEKNISSIADG